MSLIRILRQSSEKVLTGIEFVRGGYEELSRTLWRFVGCSNHHLCRGLLSASAALLPAGLWSAVVVLGLFSFRKRGLLLLLGTPFALYWPWVFVALRLWSLRAGGNE